MNLPTSVGEREQQGEKGLSKKRFGEVRQTLQPKPTKDRITGKCELCGKWFDALDAKVWTRETGNAHFYPCYLDFKGDVKGKAEWEKLNH